MLNEQQRERYSRHIQLPEIGESGQARLLAARVLIIGAGGLGSPVMMYLGAAGVGEITVCDFDRVELSNLQRQIVHDTSEIGHHKIDSAARTLARLNPDVKVRTIGWAIDGDDLAAEVARADVVVDASDNFETRFALNRACVGAHTPLVSGAALRLEGHVLVINPLDSNAGCYHCLYDETADDPGEACADVGVFAPLLGVIGSVQAIETLKLLLEIGESLAGRLVVFDALGTRWRSSKVRKDLNCPVCGPDS